MEGYRKIIGYSTKINLPNEMINHGMILIFYNNPQFLAQASAISSNHSTLSLFLTSSYFLKLCLNWNVQVFLLRKPKIEGDYRG